MLAQRSGTPNCFDFYPMKEQCSDWPSDSPVFVDVGGASGQQCFEFKKRFPNIKGRVILQDTPAVIADAKARTLDEGIEAMIHDFYTSQVVKGAAQTQLHRLTALANSTQAPSSIIFAPFFMTIQVISLFSFWRT